MNAPIADLAPVYQSAVTPYANPARLAVTARLLGFRPAPLAGAHVLQVGHHVAANLVALAAANRATHFVGLELGSGPLDITPLANALKLDNLHIEAITANQLAEAVGGNRFDYILCVGGYGALAPDQRGVLLHAIGKTLTPAGIACLGYLSQPGGHWHAALADMLNQHLRALVDPAQRAAQARALLGFLAQANAEDSPYGKLLRQTKAHFDLLSDQQINLEYLAPAGEPLSLTQVLQAASAAELAYLGDLDLPSMTDFGLPESARQRLSEAKHDPIRYEQYLDFVRGRAYRHTLLVGPHVAVDRNVTPDRLEGLAVASALRPVAANIDLTNDTQEDFRHPSGTVLHVTHTVTKAALAALSRRWPQAIPLTELLTTVADDHGLSDVNAARAALAADMLAYFVNGMIELHPAPLPLTTDIGALPHAWPLARLQAQHATGPVAWVTNLRHENVPVDATSREVLARLDGLHDRPALLDQLRIAVNEGRLDVRSHGQAIDDPSRLASVLVEALDVALRRLAAAGLLQPPPAA